LKANGFKIDILFLRVLKNIVYKSKFEEYSEALEAIMNKHPKKRAKTKRKSSSKK